MNPLAAAKLSVEKKYIASTPELNGIAISNLDYAPSVTGARDAVNSAAKKWTSALRHVRSLARGDLESAGWRAGGLTEEKLAPIGDAITGNWFAASYAPILSEKLPFPAATDLSG